MMIDSFDSRQMWSSAAVGAIVPGGAKGVDQSFAQGLMQGVTRGVVSGAVNSLNGTGSFQWRSVAVSGLSSGINSSLGLSSSSDDLNVDYPDFSWSGMAHAINPANWEPTAVASSFSYGLASSVVKAGVSKAIYGDDYRFDPWMAFAEAAGAGISSGILGAYRGAVGEQKGSQAAPTRQSEMMGPPLPPGYRDAVARGGVHVGNGDYTFPQGPARKVASRSLMGNGSGVGGQTNNQSLVVGHTDSGLGISHTPFLDTLNRMKQDGSIYGSNPFSINENSTYEEKYAYYSRKFDRMIETDADFRSEYAVKPVALEDEFNIGFTLADSLSLGAGLSITVDSDMNTVFAGSIMGDFDIAGYYDSLRSDDSTFKPSIFLDHTIVTSRNLSAINLGTGEAMSGTVGASLGPISIAYEHGYTGETKNGHTTQNPNVYQVFSPNGGEFSGRSYGFNFGDTGPGAILAGVYENALLLHQNEPVNPNSLPVSSSTYEFYDRLLFGKLTTLSNQNLLEYNTKRHQWIMDKINGELQ